MRSGIVLGACVVLVSGASAQTQCTPRDYAQLKDLAKTSNGRHNMPLDYCIAEIQRSGLAPNSAGYAACTGEMEKLRQVMLSAKMAAHVRYADEGCKGDPPRK